MTDLEKLKSCFDEIGQNYHQQKAIDIPIYDTTIVIFSDDGDGDCKAICEFYFLNGKYVGHGIWK